MFDGQIQLIYARHWCHILCRCRHVDKSLKLYFSNSLVFLFPPPKFPSKPWQRQNGFSTTGSIPPGHLLLLLYGSAQQYFENGQVNRGLVKKLEGLERLRCVKKKKKYTRVENSPDDYFAEMNLQRMTAGVEWKKREILSLSIHSGSPPLFACVPPSFTPGVLYKTKY